MRVGVIADIHSNLPALEAVLDDMGTVDALWCLGDFVGYGPWPNECISMLSQRVASAIVGNHDLAAIGAINTDDFNLDAAIVVQWTAGQLAPDSRRYLKSLEPRLQVDGVTLAHGSPREPVWEYVISEAIAEASFPAFETQLCLVGHTHIPSVFLRQEGEVTGVYMRPGHPLPLGAYQVIANPGSVGQPRDRDRRAAYMIYDTDSTLLDWRRVEYDISIVQARMREAGLPQYFIDRLERGA